jgi:hypothetical protein
VNLPRKTEDRIRYWLLQAFQAEPLEAQERVVDFTRELRARHANYADYVLYHVLVGSTPSARCRRVDFPGHEVEHFVRHLVDEMSHAHAAH